MERLQVAESSSNKASKKIQVSFEVDSEEIRNKFVGLARSKGTKATTLLREWVLAYLADPERHIPVLVPQSEQESAEEDLGELDTLQNQADRSNIVPFSEHPLQLNDSRLQSLLSALPDESVQELLEILEFQNELSLRVLTKGIGGAYEVYRDEKARVGG